MDKSNDKNQNNSSILKWLEKPKQKISPQALGTDVIEREGELRLRLMRIHISQWHFVCIFTDTVNIYGDLRK